jgi:membrane peptidoglycan carboxypeptidase
MSAEDLEKIKVVASDKLSAWAITYLKNADGEARGLRAMLDAAMARRYSGSTSERFFTGGGSHKFNNFDHDDDGGFWTVTESLQKSINLPFVRLMRDVIQHLMAQRLDYSSMLQNIKDPRRQEYLERFAHKEARHFLVRFYGKYQGTKPAQAFDILVGNAKGRPRRFAVLFRSVYPHASLAEFTAAMRIHYPVGVLSAAGINRLYSQYAPATMNLVDRAYTARIHPLEVWLVAYMQENESLSLTRALNASTSEQLAVYRWLFETKNINRQNKRIQIILEEEAFTELQKRWYKLGFPFGALVPSYATALGSSGDRPLALAELVGIVINNGVRYPTQRFKELRFGENTPFETLMLRTPTPSEQVLNPVIAQVVKEALANVAEKGTAQRIKGAFTLADGRSMAVGGKTGTGDNRYQAFGPGGKLVSSKVVNRTATFVFFIGERFFGVIVVHIPGAAAAQQRFTSALPVQTLKVLAPTLLPLLRASGEISDLKSQ